MLATLSKALLALRYRIKTTGLDSLPPTRGILVLPNHPAEIDPVIVTTLLWNKIRVRPVVLESFYYLPVLHSLMRWLRAIPMADMSFDSGPYKRRRVEKALSEVVSSLHNGDNILMYPSGRLSVSGAERLVGTSGVYALLQRYPDVKILLVRTRGLYGSIFSKAISGPVSPDLFPTLRRAAGILLKNFLFFTPKRDVTFHTELNPADFPRNGSAAEINRYLENWYNQPAPETPILVSHSAFKLAVPILPPAPAEGTSTANAPSDVVEKVKGKLAALAKVSPEKLTMDSELGDDLGLDSLTLAEVLLWLDQEFEATDVDLGELTTVGSVVRAAAGLLEGHAPRREYQVPSTWSAGLPSRAAPHIAPHVTTIPQAFLEAAARMKDASAVGDERSGAVSWKRFQLAAVLVAKKLESLSSSYVGVLLPASVAAATVTAGSTLARKVPVYLNWTAGKRSLEHAISSTGLEKVITSRSFLDIVQVDLEFMENRFVFVEDIVRGASLPEKFAAKLLCAKPPSSIARHFKLETVNAEDPAVVLFTSGSESLPKGVPLSHKNILSNVRGALDVFSMRADDALLGFLPPFHSFGLTICTIMPLTTGLRAAYRPNPNESRKIAKAILPWDITLVAGTPTFLKSILKAGSPEQFAKLRLLVSGAEKAPKDLFEMVDGLGSGKALLEGYGITECSPVVTVNRPAETPSGVGKPMPGVEVRIVHPESHARVDDGTQGLILIKGPNVFPGYVGTSLDPFVTVDGDRWYNSGDLGYLHNGSLVITGRLKRFIKIGGEMISLGAVEEAFAPLVPSPDGAPTVAILARGAEGTARPELVLFCGNGGIDTDQANEHLKANGFPHIVRIAEVKKLKAIPVLGTGKTDYQSLKAQLS